MSDLSLMRFRVCRRCGCTKPLSLEFFFCDKQNTSGFRYGCKVCALIRQALKRLENPEAHRERERQRASATHIKAQRRQYVDANREIYRAACRKWREKNPGKQLQSTYKWRKANPGKVAGFHRKRRARKLGAEHEPYTSADINDMWHEQEGHCYYCGAPVFGAYHLDHKQPLSRGGADKLDNLCIACPFCNSSKKDKTEQEFADYRTLPKLLP